MILLDIRGRWWLSLWLWLPLGTAILFLAESGRNKMEYYGTASARGFFVFVDEDGLVTGVDPDRFEATAQVNWSLNIRHTEWTLAVSRTSIRTFRLRVDSPVPTRPSLAGVVATQASLRLDVTDVALPPHVRRDVQEWIDKALPEMLTSGDLVRSRRPPLRRLAPYVGLTVIQYLCCAGLLLALIGWLLRGAQIGAYRRMLRRHEAGRCPHCDYDISAAPDLPCPECGCDHRARRAEAVEALQRARR